MTSKELRQKFLDFFEQKGHKILPSSSLIPSDPTVLFTSAGMQRFTSYLSGEKDILKDFGTRHLASSQKCFRTADIEEVGDAGHHTFFEMLGNWSIGQDPQKGYFKFGAIKYALEFLTHKLGLDKDRFWVALFQGEDEIPSDKQSMKIWKDFGISDDRIKFFGMEENFWGPVAQSGPCGPNTEIHYDRGKSYGCGHRDCGPNCPRCERFVEIWNLVFMEYFKDQKGNFEPLPQKSVDTGAGLERLTAVLQEKNSTYETDLFLPIISQIKEMLESQTKGPSSFDYLFQPARAVQKEVEKARNLRAVRIIADHIRGVVFLASEEVLPSNEGRGYILRRILRRAQRFGKILGLPSGFLIPLAKKVIQIYKGPYPELQSHQPDILTVIQKEQNRFKKALEKGISETCSVVSEKGKLGGKTAFKLYETYSIPPEFSKEIARQKGAKIDKNFEEDFEKAFEKHRKVSRAGAQKKFGGVGQEVDYETKKLHTATHLLQAALRKVLGEQVKQRGSDVNSKRLRFDFSYPKKLTKEEIKKVQDLVNQKINQDLKVTRKEMGYKEAIESGALAFFKGKYPHRVTVYSVSDSSGKVFSKEVCAGPHVKKTSELGKFEIVKEESSGAGVRRIKAILK